MEKTSSQKKCPVCGKYSTEKYTPFCSKKCADIDLGRWLKGTYVVHTDEKPQESDYENIQDKDD